MNIIDSILKAIGSFYSTGNRINSTIGTILAVAVLYKAVYFVVGMFFTRKFKPAKKMHKYGIVIAARNEQAVIGNLIDSINKQDYPKELYQVFVVADNCTDNTAEIARKKGAICYERHDEEHRTKGYALEFLFENIAKDYGIESYEGYFVFDADNLLKSNYISKMNDAFDSGEKIITSFRNTKNFDENWIASTYALHWIRSSRINHRARSIFRVATNIQGTGFLFSNEIVKDGWHYVSLTEDRALTVDAVAQGYEISYQDEAEFFDEQPVSLKIALRQRLRWSKGHLQAFAEKAPYLFMNVIFGKKFIKTNWNEKNVNKSTVKNRFVESIRHRFASFDILVQTTPLSLINFIRWIIFSLIIYSCFTYANGITNVSVFSGGAFLPKLLRELFNVKINISPGLKAMFIGFVITVWFRLLYRISVYFTNMLTAVYLFVIEDARIKKMSLKKKILYTITWPTFDMIGRYTMYLAVFKKVTWKPIPHESKVTIEDLV